MSHNAPAPLPGMVAPAPPLNAPHAPLPPPRIQLNPHSPGPPPPECLSPPNACPPPRMLVPYFCHPALRACPSVLLPHSCSSPCYSCRIRPDNLCAIIDHDNRRLSRLGKRDSGAHIGHEDKRPASIADRKECEGSQHRLRG
jgi:hypothetical protein